VRSFRTSSAPKNRASCILGDLQLVIRSFEIKRLRAKAEVVALVTQELNADLLVIGRASPSEFLGRLEMTEYSIIRQSPCPVISV
jgi:nucleotide-binding universal stress UspA family protein